MKNTFSKTIIVVATALALLVGISSAEEMVPGRLYIKFQSGYEPGDDYGYFSSIPQVNALLAANGVHKRVQPFGFFSKPDDFGLKRWYGFHLDNTADIPAIVSSISNLPGVEIACGEPTRSITSPKSGSGASRWIEFFPNDPYYTLQWAHPNISAPAAWDIILGNPNVVIAVVDNGVDWDHPDLVDNIWTNPNESYNGLDDDFNGKIDDVHGWDFIGWDNDPSVDNDSSFQDIFHGTHVSGIAAGVMNNGRGIAGLAPGCKIMSLKVGQGKGISTMAAAEAINYAHEMGAKVINCSFGGTGSFTPEEEAISSAFYAGILTVAAAGNDYLIDPSQYPAQYPLVLSAASTDAMNIVSNFGSGKGSNTADWVDVCAPGSYIYSTWVSNSGQPGYSYASGTSMSSPLVAGLAGLVYSLYPDWDARNVTIKIKNTCDNIYGFNDNIFAGKLGAGRINAYRAVAELIPGLRLDSFIIDDTVGGNGDGVVNANETVDIIVTLNNIFEDASGVTGYLATEHEDVEVISADADFGEILSGSSKNNSGEPFQVQVGMLPGGEEINFTLLVSTDVGYEFNLWFTIMVSPPYATHDIGNVRTTVTSFGAIGYNQDPYGTYHQLIGQGFCYPATGGNTLYHGALLLGTGPDAVCSSLLTDPGPSLDFEWEAETTINMHPGEVADQQSEATYHDDDVFSPASVTVEQLTYAWSEAGYDDFIIMDFVFTNDGGADLNGCYAGVYLDWDISDPDFNSDGYDYARGMGYMWGESSAFYGVSILSDTPTSYKAINLEIHGLDDATLYSFMTGGINPSYPGSSNDYAQLLSFGPFDLPAGGVDTFGVALLGGNNLDDLKANADSAMSKYITDIHSGSLSGSSVKHTISISPPYPNPFNLSTSFTISLNSAGRVDLTLYDILGRRTMDIYQGYIPAGVTSFDCPAEDLASGVYFLRAHSGDASAMRKIVIIK